MTWTHLNWLKQFLLDSIMRKLFFLHVVFSYSICVAVGAYIGSTLNNNTPTSGIRKISLYDYITVIIKLFHALSTFQYQLYLS